MYCTKCGTEIMDGNKFCTGCGAKVGGEPAERTEVKTEVKEQPGTEAAASTVAIPMQIRTGMLKTQAGILLIGRPYSALIRFDNKQYQKIVADGNKGGNYFQKVSGMMAAFGEYAEGLENVPAREAAAAHPGSIVFEDAQVKRLKIWNGWDASREQYDDFYSFEFLAGSEKYKGTLERSVNMSRLNARLRGVLGGRFG